MEYSLELLPYTILGSEDPLLTPLPLQTSLGPKLGLKDHPTNTGTDPAITPPQDKPPNELATAADNSVKFDQQLQNIEKTDPHLWLQYMASTHLQPQWELYSLEEEGAGDANDNTDNTGD
ncbi:hypothetical protein E4T56_gene1026 [Termitomyces sp. T112]|nr:hypothetical protein E4T56_gene1026 [Termitomyces sp. T112]